MTRVSMDLPPARPSAVAGIFEEEGFSVSWSAPVEKRAGGAGAEFVHVVFTLGDDVRTGLVGYAAVTAAKRAIETIRQRFPGVSPKIEDEDELPTAEDEPPTAEDDSEPGLHESE